MTSVEGVASMSTPFGRFLAGVVLALAALGPIVEIEGAFVSWGQIMLVPLVSHVALHAMSRGARSDVPYWKSVALGAGLLAVGVLSARSLPSATLAYLNFLTGTVAALAVVSQLRLRKNNALDMIDYGTVVFVAVTCYQHFFLGAEFATAGEIHASLIVAWGGSNYVGAVLVIAACWLLARAYHVSFGRWLLAIAAGVAIFTAASTLSRGAVVALAAGLLVFAWGAGKSPLRKFLWRLTAVASPFAAAFLMDWVLDARFGSSGADPATNVDARFTLYRLAVEEFLRSPLVGTGWVGLREVSATVFISPISFAHNWYLSALQIAGMTAIPILIAFTLAVFTSVRFAGVYGAPAAAAFAASLIEPVMEGFVGAMVIWSVLLAGAALRGSRRPIQGDAGAGEMEPTSVHARPAVVEGPGAARGPFTGMKL